MILRKFHELLSREVDGKLNPSQPSGLTGPEQPADGPRMMLAKLEEAQCFSLSQAAASAAQMVAAQRDPILAAQDKLTAPSATCWFDMPSDNLGHACGFLWIGDELRNPFRQGAVFIAMYQPGSAVPTLVPCLIDLDQLLGGSSVETFWLMSIWLLMESDSARLCAPVTYTKLNKQRRAKGLRPLLGFTPVTLTREADHAVKAHSAATRDSTHTPT